MDSSLTRSLSWRKTPTRELLRLAWPITVSQISFSLMTAVDTVFVGHLGAAALAGVALGGIATFTILCFGIGMLRATKITVSQAVGAGRSATALAYLGASLWVALGLGVAFAVLGQVAAHFLPLLTDGGASGQIARQYASLRLLAAPIVLVGIALREARHALGDARSPMIATLIANAVNVALVSVFLLHFEWGVAGVAWSTTAAQLVEVLVLVAMQRERGFGRGAWTWADLRALVRLGTPLGVERFFDVASFSVLVAVCAQMGDLELASHQVATQALMFAFMPSMAIGEAACVLLGQAVGAASLRSVPRVQRAALVVCFAYAALCSATMIGAAASIAGVFTRDAAVVARAVELFAVSAVFVWVLPFYQIGQSSLRAVGDVRAAALITVTSAWGCTPIFATVFGLWLGMGALGGWIGIGGELALAAALFWWRLGGRGGWLRKARRCRAALRMPARASVPALAG